MCAGCHEEQDGVSMTRILITGGRGFLGRNLAAHLRVRNDCEVAIFDQQDSSEDLRKWLLEADIVFHLAGINRPENPSDFESGNIALTEQICQILIEGGRIPKIIFSSSIQAELDNPYGKSKARAESALRQFSVRTGGIVRIYRLKNLFGKWCRPNYNSVTATFCHNIANDLSIAISDPDRMLELCYVEDVVESFLSEIDGKQVDGDPGSRVHCYSIQLGDLAGRIQAFHEMRSSLTLPDFSDRFNRALYATYLSYVPSEEIQQSLAVKSDARGSLAEFIIEKHFGQIFVSRTHPGVTRGNHYHHTKTEKFLVVEGDGLISMRAIQSETVEEYFVTGSAYQVIDIPPGMTHSIRNVGTGEMVTLFWASEIFNPDRPDTYYLPVDFKAQGDSVVVERK